MPTQLSLSKFLSFLDSHNLEAQDFFVTSKDTETLYIAFVKCICKTNGIYFMLSISSKYKIPIKSTDCKLYYLKQIDADNRLEDYLSSVSGNLTDNLISLSNLYLHKLDMSNNEFLSYILSENSIFEDNLDSQEEQLDVVDKLKQDIVKIEENVNDGIDEQEILEFDVPKIVEEKKDIPINKSDINNIESILGLVLIDISFSELFTKAKKYQLDTYISDETSKLNMNEKEYRDKEYIELDIELSNLSSSIKEKYNIFEKSLAELLSKRTELMSSITKIDELMMKVSETHGLIDKRKDASKLLNDISFELLRKKDKYDEFVRNLNFHLSSINSLYSLLDD